MIYTEMTKKAMRLAYDAHHGVNDKSGMPYIFHPFHLAEGMTDEVTTTVALLHDIVEDTDYTLDDLAAMGFPESVTKPLALLTHAEGVDYFDYVRNISADPVASAVKLADLVHNSDLSRFAPEEITEYALKRREKYLKAMEILRKGKK